MTISDDNNPKKPRQTNGRGRPALPSSPLDKAPRQPRGRRRHSRYPECINDDDEALRWSWDAMQESGGWR